VSNADDDPELTVALAEYAHISELRSRLDQKSSTRFSFFLALSTAVTAIVAGMMTQLPNESAILAVSAVLGFMLLVFGYAIFLRQVAFASYSRRLTAAQTAIRAYLAKRAPGLRPYMLLPIGSDRGAFPDRQSPMGGFAGAIAILNSAILALVIGLWIGHDGFTFVAGVLATIAFLVSLGIHLVHIERSRTISLRKLAALEKERGI
jgi:hypothetical protein